MWGEREVFARYDAFGGRIENGNPLCVLPLAPFSAAVEHRTALCVVAVCKKKRPPGTSDNLVQKNTVCLVPVQVEALGVGAGPSSKPPCLPSSLCTRYCRSWKSMFSIFFGGPSSKRYGPSVVATGGCLFRFCSMDWDISLAFHVDRARSGELYCIKQRKLDQWRGS